MLAEVGAIIRPAVTPARSRPLQATEGLVEVSYGKLT